MTMKGGTVNGFTMDNALGEFILTHPNMRIPKQRAIYSVNEGNTMYWDEKTVKYFNSLKYPEEGGKPYSSRYIGSMVADAYRTLLYGGIFAYPADKKSPKGKLRILYECAVSAKCSGRKMYLLTILSSQWRWCSRMQVARLSTAGWRGCWRSSPSTSTTAAVSSWVAGTRWRRLSRLTRHDSETPVYSRHIGLASQIVWLRFTIASSVDCVYEA